MPRRTDLSSILIVGSGIYVIPASLAEIAGPVSLLAWGIVAAGYACLAISCCRRAERRSSTP